MFVYLSVRLIEHLRKTIETGALPGEEAHLRLSPALRVRTSEVQKQQHFKPKQSAVLILLYPEDGLWHNVLIKRPVYNGTHSGQIAFPGGRYEDGDASFEDTALRECEEEIGVRSEDVSILGKISDVYIPPSNFMVHPYVGYVDQKPNFVPDDKEVESIITYPIDWLNKANIIQQTKIKFSSGFSLDTPYFDIHSEIVWGATAIMLSEFREMLP